MNSQWIYSLLVEQISRPQNRILRVISMITKKMLSSFLCSQSPGLSLPIFTLLHLLSRQKDTNVFARIWRKIYVRLLDLMLCLSSPTGNDFSLILSRNSRTTLFNEQFFSCTCVLVVVYQNIVFRDCQLKFHLIAYWLRLFYLILCTS